MKQYVNERVSSCRSNDDCQLVSLEALIVRSVCIVIMKLSFFNVFELARLQSQVGPYLSRGDKKRCIGR